MCQTSLGVIVCGLVPTTQGGRGGRGGPGAAGFYGSGRRGRPPAYNRPQRYDKDKFLQANFRFLVSGVCVTRDRIPDS